jgi:ribosomal protein S18 acetylase RimI-like enzyme
MTRDALSVSHRVVPLDGGGRLRVRPVEPGDVDGLMALYDQLSDEDRYMRFFSAYEPDRAFFERLASVVGRGGFGIVALDDEDRIVAEANYELLPDGDGELGIVVSPAWRGGLGAYMLDTLIEAADRRGVPNIEADVLVTNSRMLSLLRARGYATLPSDDWVSLRLMVGTHGPTPAWPHDGPGRPDASRPRVLVEAPGGRWSGAPEGEAAGLTFVTCSGPRGLRPRCPVLAGRPCPLAAGADVIVVANAPDEAPWPELVAAHADLHPGVPVCVERRGGPPLDVRTVGRLARLHLQASDPGRL